MYKNLLLFSTLSLFIGTSIIAQDTIDVNLNMRHIVGASSTFDRSKYVVIHDDLTGNEWERDAEKKSFFEDYDVYFGRNNGSIVWEYNNTREDSDKPGWPDINYMQSRGSTTKSNYANETFTHQFENRYSNMIIGGQEHMFPHGQATTREGLIYDENDFEATAEFYANYLKYFFGEGGVSGIPLPKMLEVMNEPFVKANQLGTTKLQLAKLHNFVAERVKEVTPEVMVGGYSAAHPAFEAAGFNLWRDNWKMFIDEAGANMDFFSFHLYDFAQDISDMNQEKHRAGSNIEAIMDMINHYSYLRLGETKPWSVSEYGWLCKECEGGYDPKEDWYNLRSFNNMMLQLMERPDQIINAIPFMLLKANWAKPEGADYNTYGPRLYRELGELPGEVDDGTWMYTHLLQYFQLWANVNGTRIDTKPTDFDVLSDAFVDGKKVYLILSNLNEEVREINLKYFGAESNTVENIMVKHSYAIDDYPKLDTTYYNMAIDKISLGSQATMILEYTYSNDVLVDESITETEYFGNGYLRPISANQNIAISVNGVTVDAQGEAMLRVGLGRDHGRSLKPTITVNGTQIKVPSDWRGYDQLTRDSFFGVIEVPVPYELLSLNNNVSVSFPDGGGYLTSMVLRVYNMSKAIERSEFNYSYKDVSVKPNLLKQINLYPNPAQRIIRVNNPVKQGLNYSLFNIQGQLLGTGLLNLSANSIDVSTLTKGMYYTKLTMI